MTEAAVIDQPSYRHTNLKLIKSVDHPENDGYEADLIQRGTDQWVPAAGRGGHAHRGA